MFNQKIQELEDRIKSLESEKNNSYNNNRIDNSDNKDRNFLNYDNIIIIKKGLLFFFIILSGNYLGKLLACHTQRIFTNSMIVKHIIGFISLYFFVIITDEKMKKYNPLLTLSITVLIYFYFLLMAKVETTYFLIIMILLSLLVFLQIYSEYLYNKPVNNLDNYEKIIKNKINKVQYYILILSVILTIFGVLVYIGMKKEEYGKDFEIYYFLLGKPNCKNNLILKNNAKIDAHRDFKHHFRYALNIFTKTK